MRHQCKKNTLGKAADQRRALLRSLATELFTHGEITTTMTRAKALAPYAERVVTLAKKGDLAARRQAGKYIFDKELSSYIDLESGEIFDTLPEGKKYPKTTVLRKIFCTVGKKYATRNGGYTKIYRQVPRRGDNAEMALIQLT